MREMLVLSSCAMVGKFSANSQVEIDTEMQNHGNRVLPIKAIEDFIEQRSNDHPFELWRTNRKTYPPHKFSNDKQLCHAGFCLYSFDAMRRESYEERILEPI